MSFAKSVWDTLSKVNCSSHIEKKGQLSYLSWTWAWAELMDKYPESTYTRLPDVRYPDDSVEVGFQVTVREGDQAVTREMWLPVMDNRNGAIKNPDARKISDSRMRCLVKCLALFGLGHYIYAGEDLPEGAEAEGLEDALKNIGQAEDMDALKATFAAAWESFTDKDSRKKLTDAKDKRKGELA